MLTVEVLEGLIKTMAQIADKALEQGNLELALAAGRVASALYGRHMAGIRAQQIASGGYLAPGTCAAFVREHTEPQQSARNH